MGCNIVIDQRNNNKVWNTTGAQSKVFLLAGTIIW